jgi:hypothetical protein
MRAFILTFALSLPLGLAACADSPTEEAYEEGAPIGDREDVIGDGEIIDEEGEPDANVLGDGILYGGYDTDEDGLLSESEYDAGIGDGAFATYDTDGDGFLSEDEYSAYESSMTM